MSSQMCIIVAILAYLVLMLCVGWYFSNRNKTTDGFYLGGRKLGPFVVAISAEASDMSSWLLMGLPGLAYLTGICDPGSTAIGLAIGTYLNWLFVARKIRLYTHATNSITLPSFFSNRYGDKKTFWRASQPLSSSFSSSRTPHPALLPAASCSTRCSASTTRLRW